MSGKKKGEEANPLLDRSEYSELLEETIDDLNADHSFKDTSLERVVEDPPRRQGLFSSFPFMLLLGFLILNLIIRMYYIGSQGAGVVSMNEANIEAVRILEQEPALVQGLEGFIKDYSEFDSKESPAFLKSLSELNSCLGDKDLEDWQVNPQDFRYSDKAIYWTDMRR